ncbi:pyridoxamine 5'-phosphate oxidase family protein [Nocardia arizonensis]|uniref:pyridoxamine 5'-phosphate oxidase family protein n=1 Tax=Nocardia arizonensis TaxID=1141647 RepID=UPI0006D10273|nr:pyridoxamine 5'-phosphate oxidase family protein [Nocardia arizonensis]
MTTWSEFTEQAPTISEVFIRRHRATGNLCMLATLRADGSPRISPVEPRVFEGDLVIAGMPDTTKFHDLARDPRFCLHTATVDPMVGDGDAKLFGTVTDIPDISVHRRFAQALFEETGFDIRDQEFDHYFTATLTGASTVEVTDDHLRITIWTPGKGEHVVEKH